MINTQGINPDNFPNLSNGETFSMTSAFPSKGVSLPCSEKGTKINRQRAPASQLLLKGKRVHSIARLRAKFSEAPLPFAWSRLPPWNVQSSFSHQSWQRVSRVFLGSNVQMRDRAREIGSWGLQVVGAMNARLGWKGDLFFSRWKVKGCGADIYTRFIQKIPNIFFLSLC